MIPVKATAVLRRFSMHAKVEFQEGPPGHIEAVDLGRQLERGYGVSLGSNYEDVLPPKEVETGSGSATLLGFTDAPAVVSVAKEFARRLELADLRSGEVFWAAE